jgi:flagellar biosynthesis protein FlhB
MAERDEKPDDLGEEISQFRLAEFRRTGRVAQSRELTGALGLAVGILVLHMLGSNMAQNMSLWMHRALSLDGFTLAKTLTPELLRAWCLDLCTRALRETGGMVAPFALIVLFVGVLVSFAQIGPILSLTPLMPDFKRIDPLAGCKRYFSMKHQTDAVRICLKLGTLLWIGYWLLKSRVLRIQSLAQMDVPSMVPVLVAESTQCLALLAFFLLVFACLDFAHQKWEYRKSLRMTKQEAKQEHKEREGDPQIKARIRSLQRQMARKRMMSAVRTADVVITNPTHLSIAIKYDRGSMHAPKVVARGADFLALKIREIAEQAGVPRVENVPLARALYRSVRVNQSIPQNLYQAVAEVLAFVYKLKGRR